ncbi:hypothetical protein [Streptomyces sp.]|uniref:hypothetical protein n=1 Tax=Streptomyces sp. TaxID=1931 RepID=UPI002F920A01
MDAAQPTALTLRTVPAPSRRLIAAGIRRGSGPLSVEYPQMSAADKAAHAAASYVRPRRAS